MHVETLSWRTDLDIVNFMRGMARIESAAERHTANINRVMESVKPPKLARDPFDKFLKMAAGPQVPQAATTTATSSVAGMASSALGAAASFGKLTAAVVVVEGAAKAAGSGFEFLAHGVKGASDLNEAINKSNVLLGEAAPAARALADDYAKSFGLAKVDTIGLATSIGALGKNAAGLKGDDLAKFATGLTKLAADVSSIDNTPLAEVGRSFAIALSGEQSDMLKRLGVDTREAAVEQFAFSRGIARVGQTLTEAQKVMARHGILTEKLGFASGDLSRTINDPANAYRKFSGTVENLGASIGTALMPPVQALLGGLNELATWGTDAFERHRAAVERWAGSAADSIKGVIRYIEDWDKSLEMAGVLAQATFLEMQIDLADFGDNSKAVFDHMRDNWTDVLTDMGSAYATWIKNSMGNSLELGRFIADPSRALNLTLNPLEGFRAKTPALPGMAGGNGLPADDPLMKRLGQLQMQIQGVPGFAGLGKLNTNPYTGKGVASGKPVPAMAAPAVAKPPDPLMGEEALKKAKEHFQELERFSKALTDKVRTPFEEYKHIIDQGKEALANNLIDKQQFGRLDKYARKESGLDKLENPETRFAGAANVGTGEFVTALNRALFGTAPKQDDRLERLTQAEINELKGIRADIKRQAADPAPTVRPNGARTN